MTSLALFYSLMVFFLPSDATVVIFSTSRDTACWVTGGQRLATCKTGTTPVESSVPPAPAMGRFETAL